ncbi:MAG: hypothetical protein WBB01_00275 [Phormidesmis sp.]
MKSLKAVGIVFSLITIAPTAQAAQITFGFDAFIPTARIDNPVAEVLPPFFTEFIGDNRDFNREATFNGEARLFTQVVLDTDAPDPLVSALSEAGTTVGFLLKDGVEVSQSDKTAPISSVEATRMSQREILLKVAASATNPLVDNFLPPEVEVPPAEYIYDIALTLFDGGIGYNLVGTNREFPSYSVFLNQTPILLNPANADDALLLGNIEPVSAMGTVSVDEPVKVNEPVSLIALGMMGFLLVRKKNWRGCLNRCG